MITLTIENLNFELEDLKNRSNIFEPNQSYLGSYIEFVNYFKEKDYIDKKEFIIGCYFVYGWMPTILDFRFEKFNDKSDFILSYIYQVKNRGHLLEHNEISELIQIINNSLVGTSKLLHFINPSDYAIWDSNIFHYFFPEKKSTFGIEKPELYLEYLKALKDITLQNEFDNLYIKITEFLNLDYEISKFRAIELLIFEIMRNRKI